MSRSKRSARQVDGRRLSLTPRTLAIAPASNNWLRPYSDQNSYFSIARREQWFTGTWQVGQPSTYFNSLTCSPQFDTYPESNPGNPAMAPPKTEVVILRLQSQKLPA